MSKPLGTKTNNNLYIKFGLLNHSKHFFFHLLTSAPHFTEPWWQQPLGEFVIFVFVFVLKNQS